VIGTYSRIAEEVVDPGTVAATEKGKNQSNGSSSSLRASPVHWALLGPFGDEKVPKPVAS
jgi:hypothetical protein